MRVSSVVRRRWAAPLSSLSFSSVIPLKAVVPRASAVVPTSTSAMQVGTFKIQSRHMSSLPSGVIPLPMPSLSPTMTAGTVTKWRKTEGQRVMPGDVLCEIGTDKATVDFVLEDEGFLAVILVAEGASEVPLGQPLALLADSEEAARAVAALGRSADQWRAELGAGKQAAGQGSAPAAAASAPSEKKHTSTSTSAAADLPPTAVMPSAKLLMVEHNIDPSVFAGRSTGKGGRITKGDVLSFLGKAPAQSSTTATAPSNSASTAAHAPAPAPTAAAVSSSPASGVSPRAGFTDTKPSQVRRVIAQRLTESKAFIPHQYGVMDCQLDALMKVRNQLKEAGVTLSVNDMIVKAVAKALRDVPEANCFYDPKTDTVKPNATVDISVAVATDGGLITPIVKGADKLGLMEINDKVKDLAARARANRLKPEEFQGGSFTISNLGMFGIDEFTAVINPPQACILAVGKGEKKVLGAPITNLDNLEAVVPEPTVATVMSVTLSSDARVLDAALSGQFLQVFRHYIEKPALLMS